MQASTLKYPNSSRLSSPDTLKWTLTASVLAHLLVVLGISFVIPDVAQQQAASPPLTITLVTPEPAAAKPNPDARAIAQQNHHGQPLSQTLPITALPTPLSQALPITALPTPLPQTAARAPQQPPRNTAPSQRKIAQPDAQQPPTDSHAQRRAQLTAALNLAYLNDQTAPREKFVSANAKQSIFADYLKKWRLTVEKIGNLNYPDAAKQQNLEGNLVLDVVLRTDGSVDTIRVLRSSGYAILDDAAKRIVHLAAPFGAFTRQMSAQVDKLHIIRTWEFGKNRLHASAYVAPSG